MGSGQPARERSSSERVRIDIAMMFRLYLRLANPLAVGVLLLVLLAVYFGISVPYFTACGVVNPLSPWDFGCLALASLCITAGGYMINNYFDRQEDKVRHPQRVSVGRDVPRRTVIVLHHSLNLLASLLALYVAVRAHRVSLFILYPLAAGVVWFYTTLYKYQLLMGSLLALVFAFCLPMVPMMYTVSFAELSLWQPIALEQLSMIPLVHYYLLYAGSFAGIVLLLHWVRELAAFVQGRQLGRNSLASQFGLRKARIVVALCYVVLAILSFWLSDHLAQKGLGGRFPYLCQAYDVLLVIVPMGVSLIVLLTAEKVTHYRLALRMLEVSFFAVVLFPLLRLLMA